MKKILFPLTVIVVALLFFSGCQGHKSDIQTKIYAFADSTEYAHVSVSAELPVSYKGIDEQILHVLHQALDERLSRITSFETQRFFMPYNGDLSDNDAFMGYYFDEVMKFLGGLSRQDAEDRVKYIAENEELSEELKAELLATVPYWEYEYQLSKIEESPKYVVFKALDYLYMGGAHGGTGFGYMTFSKRDGHLILPFLDSAFEEDMQPLLLEGLGRYLVENGETVEGEDIFGQLFLDDNHIPLPASQPYPAKEGLVFTYMQNEIGPYSLGMPSFTVPYEKVAPYLTSDARRSLGL